MSGLNNVIPIFIFSLPRSGSTLLQRLLSTDENIASASEPWILLPLLSTIKQNNVDIKSVYGQQTALDAIEDFYSLFSGGKEEYLKEIRDLVISLYSKICNGKTYFLDKTPRYTLISEEIYNTFPDGKYIVLWRNPLAIIASAIETWKGGNWGISHLKIDLYEGIESLVNFYEAHSDNIVSINYEDLTSDIKEIERIFSYLNLDYNEKAILDFSNIKMDGRMGDPTGTHKYSKIINNDDKWKTTLSSPLRKWWCARYLKWIGEKRLHIMGYELNFLLKSLDEIPNSYTTLVEDIFRFIYGEINTFFMLDNIKLNFNKFLLKKTIYPFH